MTNQRDRDSTPAPEQPSNPINHLNRFQRRSTRRAFVIGGVGLIAAGAITAPLLTPTARRHVLAENIIDYFSYLQLNKNEVLQFIDDFEAQRFSLWRNPLKYWQEMPSSVYVTFLASTDFFMNGSQTAKPVHYLGLSGGYFMCNNPFTSGHLADGEEQLPATFRAES